MAKLIMKVQGNDGVVELMTDRVVISHPGFWNALKFGFNSAREIPLGAISEIGFKNSNMFMFGEIDFIMAGRTTAPVWSRKKPVNPNAVKFRKDKQKEFEILKEKVFELMAQQNAQRKA